MKNKSFKTKERAIDYAEKAKTDKGVMMITVYEAAASGADDALVQYYCDVFVPLRQGRPVWVKRYKKKN